MSASREYVDAGYSRLWLFQPQCHTLMQALETVLVRAFRAAAGDHKSKVIGLSMTEQGIDSLLTAKVQLAADVNRILQI